MLKSIATALLEAIVLGDGGARQSEVARLLVEASANATLADGSSVSPLAHARQLGLAAIVTTRERAGNQ